MRTAIIHHGDADGCSAGALAALGVGGDYELFSPTSGGSRIDDSIIEQAKKFEQIVVVDIGEKSQELLDDLSADSKLIWIDHHKDETEISGSFTYINPHKTLPEEKVAPASYLVYKYFASEKDMTPYIWLAALGVLGDRGEQKFPELFKKTFDIFPNLKGGKSYGDMAILKKFVGVVSSGRSHSAGRGAIEATEILIDAAKKQRPEIVLESNLMKYMRETGRQVRDIVNNREYEEHGQLILCQLNTKQYLQNYVAGRLRAIFPDKIIGVSNAGLYDNEIRLELRANNRDLRELALSIAGDLGSAGGHKGATGIRVPKDKWNILKERLLEATK